MAAMAKVAFVQIHLRYQLPQFPDPEALLTVTDALVTSHLNYCNMTYKGLPLKTIQKQQVVQNAVAYAVLGAS